MRPRILHKKDFRCCFCFHVRTGTSIIGIWNLVLHVMALVLLISMLVHPEVKDRFSNWTGFTPAPSLSPLALDGGEMDEQGPPNNPPQLPDLSAGPASTYAIVKGACTQNIPLALIVTLCGGGMTVSLLYGAIKGRPYFLMPFFCLQIFDFAVAALMAFGYFSYMPNVRRWVEQYKEMPLQKELLSLDPQWLCAIGMMVFILCMVVKAYLMGIVWSCFKYFRYEQMALMVDDYGDLDTGEVPALLAPDYDLIAKMPPPPPPYYPTQQSQQFQTQHQ